MSESTIDDIALDIAMDLTPRVGPGRQAKAVSMTVSRDLTAADLAMPITAPPIKAPPLKRLRDSHHALARTLASGVAEAEAAIITGYAPSRISILKADPSFIELLEFYRGHSSDIVADLRSRMANMGLDALTELQERLEEKPEDFTPGLLKEIVKDMADRTGHAPQRGPTSVTQINVGLSDKMAAARSRVAALAPPIVPQQEITEPRGEAPSQQHSSPIVSRTIDHE